MAAHMKSLHISEGNSEGIVSTAETCEEESMETDGLPKLLISDELKNINVDSIIPESILKNL